MAKTAKFTVYEKLSKKQRREIDNAKRGSWGLVKPITINPPPSSTNAPKQNRMCRHIHQLVHPVLLYNLNSLSDHQQSYK